MEYPKYLISLESEFARRANSISEMKRLFGRGGFKVINAIDSRPIISSSKDRVVNVNLDSSNEFAVRAAEIFEMPLDSMIDLDNQYYLDLIHYNPGAFGCLLSHLIAMKEFLSTDSNVAFIAEDDIWFKRKVNAKDLNEVAGIIAGKPPAIASTFFFETKQVYLRNGSSISLRRSSMYNPANPEMVHSTVGYFINRSAAENILANVFPIKFASDAFGEFLDLSLIQEMWCVYPPFTLPEAAESTVEFKHKRPESHRSWYRKALNQLADLVVTLGIPIMKNMVRGRRRRMSWKPPEFPVKFVQ